MDCQLARHIEHQAKDRAFQPHICLGEWAQLRLVSRAQRKAVDAIAQSFAGGALANAWRRWVQILLPTHLCPRLCPWLVDWPALCTANGVALQVRTVWPEPTVTRFQAWFIGRGGSLRLVLETSGRRKVIECADARLGLLHRAEGRHLEIPNWLGEEWGFILLMLAATVPCLWLWGQAAKLCHATSLRLVSHPELYQDLEWILKSGMRPAAEVEAFVRNVYCARVRKLHLDYVARQSAIVFVDPIRLRVWARIPLRALSVADYVRSLPVEQVTLLHKLGEHAGWTSADLLDQIASGFSGRVWLRTSPTRIFVAQVNLWRQGSAQHLLVFATVIPCIFAACLNFFCCIGICATIDDFRRFLQRRDGYRNQPFDMDLWR